VEDTQEEEKDLQEQKIEPKKEQALLGSWGYLVAILRYMKEDNTQ
jgi:hypothetical protein